MGTNPEHIPQAPPAHSEPVTWIGRDRPFGVPEPQLAVAMTPPEAPQSRLKWTLGAIAAAVVLAFLAWKLLGGAGKPHATLAER